MGKFKQYLNENDTLMSIFDILDELSEEEIDDFGSTLYYEFFEDDECLDIIEQEEFNIEDVKEMINGLDSDLYNDILDLLDEDEFDVEDDSEVDEGVSRKMLAKNKNKKKRKFQKLSVSQLRKGKAKRKIKARKDKPKKKRYFRANKKKIQSYQKSRASAIKSGTHKVKVRRK